MRCPICENEFKKFDYNEPVVEKIRQCRQCNFMIRVQKEEIFFSIKEHKFCINYKEKNSYIKERIYDKKIETEQLKKIGRIVNFYRAKKGKKKIRYFPRFLKECYACKKIKDIKLFYKNSRCQDRHYNICIECDNIQSKKWRRKKENWIKNAYHITSIHQKKKFSQKLNFSIIELENWLDKDKFDKMWQEYEESGYGKKYQICLYRKNFDDDYNLNNLQLITFSKMIKNVFVKIDFDKVNEKLRKPVMQCKNGKIIKIWISITEAAKNLNYDCSNITKACKGKYKQYHGWEWKYL